MWALTKLFSPLLLLLILIARQILASTRALCIWSASSQGSGLGGNTLQNAVGLTGLGQQTNKPHTGQK